MNKLYREYIMSLDMPCFNLNLQVIFDPLSALVVGVTILCMKGLI